MIIFVICLLAYLFLLLSTPFLIYPEFFFYPWLISRGVVQYKDFFDDHGFFTNIFFAPFAHSLPLVTFVFIAFEVIQLGIIARLIRKRIKNSLVYFILLILYVSFQFTVVHQQIWYDAIMAFFVVVAWYLFDTENEFFGWIFFAIATMIKPTVGLFIFPFFLRSKNKKGVTVFFISWIIAVCYFISRGAFGELWRQLVLFNFVYGKSIYKAFTLGVSYKLLAIIVGGYITLLFFAIKQKRKNIPLLLATTISLIFFSFGFAKLNFAMFVPFFTLLAADVFGNKKVSRYVIIGLSLFTLIIVRDAYRTYKDCQSRQVYITQSVIDEAKKVSTFIKERKDKKTIVIGNHVELYYFLNLLPPEFIPLHFPWIAAEYPQTLSLSGIRYVIVPKKLGQYESMDTTTRKELQFNYRLIGQTPSYTIWQYNKE